MWISVSHLFDKAPRLARENRYGYVQLRPSAVIAQRRSATSTNVALIRQHQARNKCVLGKRRVRDDVIYC